MAIGVTEQDWDDADADYPDDDGRGTAEAAVERHIEDLAEYAQLVMAANYAATTPLWTLREHEQGLRDAYLRLCRELCMAPRGGAL